MAVTLTPTSGQIWPGHNLQFTASVSGTTNQAVNWTATDLSFQTTFAGAGIISLGTRTTATPATITVTATSVAFPSQSATATVQVLASAPASGGTTQTPRLPSPRLFEETCGSDPTSYCCFFPEDPICGGGGYPPGLPWPFPGGIGGGGGVTIVEGVQESTVWSDIWGGLSTLWSIVVGAVDAALVAAIAGIQSALTAIANALAAAFHTLARLAGLILKFLATLLKDIVKVAVKAIQEIGRRLAQLYEKVFKPILQALAKIRQRLMDIYNRFIRPALIILQRIRTILGILKIFHIKWAAKLDVALADIQSRIIAPFLKVLGMVNQLGNWMNLILTVGYLIQKPLWINSFGAYKGSSIALQVNAMNPPPDPHALDSFRQGPQVPTEQQSVSNLHQFLSTGQGDLPQSFQSGNDHFLQGTKQAA